MSSILNDVKKSLSVSGDASAFDDEIIVIINSILNTLTQLGVGIKTGFIISDNTTEWETLIDDDHIIGMIKMYVICRAKLLFDEQHSGSYSKVLEEEIKELEWRIHTIANYEN